MKTVNWMCVITIFILFLFQGYWIYNVYSDNRSKWETVILNIFRLSLDQEIWTRITNKPENPSNPRLIVKAAKNMSPQERTQHKGDTIYLKKSASNWPSRNLTEVYTQRFQDNLLKKKPLQLPLLDSLFAHQLIAIGLPCAPYQIKLYNDRHRVIDSISHVLKKDFTTLSTSLQPIGTQGKLYIQAEVNLPIHILVKNMIFALLSSLLILVSVTICLTYQWRMIRRSRQALQEREIAVHGAIHDLKAPLNTVFALLDLIGMDVRDRQLQGFLEKGKNQIRRLSETIESMLGPLKKQKGENLLHAYPISPEEWTDHIRKGLDVLYPAKKYTFQMINRLSEPVVYADAARLERCLRNLMENALKYSDDDVALTLIFSEDNDKIQIALQDTGWGIPKKAQKSLGKQFYRVRQPGKPFQPGYGIGLSSVKQLVKEMNGDFSFESTEGVGSIFRLRIPKQKAKG